VVTPAYQAALQDMPRLDGLGQLAVQGTQPAQDDAKT
jgi:hypothetical protein